jgi:outer membrane protein
VRGKEMDSLVSGVKKFIKAYGKEKDMRTSTVQVTRLQLYAEDKFDITKKSSKP